MHIEITYCQGNIPTFENDAARKPRTAETGGNAESGQIRKRAEGSFIARREKTNGMTLVSSCLVFARS
ncbi:hypothetical protein [Pseudomonas sp. S2_C03]